MLTRMLASSSIIKALFLAIVQPCIFVNCSRSEKYFDDGSSFRLVLRPDFPSVFLYDALDNRQSQTCPPSTSSKKGIKNLRQVLDAESRAIVLDSTLNPNISFKSD